MVSVEVKKQTHIHLTKVQLIFHLSFCQGWEMIRAGAIAKEIKEELMEMGCNPNTGCDGAAAVAAKAAFVGRTLDHYYTAGKGHGLSFQTLPDYGLVTTSAMVIQQAEDGAHYAPARSLLEGKVSDHFNGMAPLALDDCTGKPIDFNPADYEKEGGNMVLWDDVMGGAFPWDERYYQTGPFNDGFDPEFIMRHAPTLPILLEHLPLATRHQ
jgi:hypothetical protein